MENSKIQWCHHSWNLVWGCFKVSPGCTHCYAEALAKRWGYDNWGPAKTTERRTMSESYWLEPLKWNDRAAKLGQRQRVFCSSMADVFEDHPTNNQERPKLWQLIEQTPWLDWLLLTKRPENIGSMIADPWLTGSFPRNIWLGTSAENQKYLESRWDTLQSETHYLNPSVLFLSLEPLLGPINLQVALEEIDLGDEEHTWWTRPVDWVIVGGESGHNARPFGTHWATGIVADCYEAGVPVFVKQLGARPCDLQGSVHYWPKGTTLTFPKDAPEKYRVDIRLKDKKGGDWSEWPESLRVRQFPGETAPGAA